MRFKVPYFIFTCFSLLWLSAGLRPGVAQAEEASHFASPEVLVAEELNQSTAEKPTAFVTVIDPDDYADQLITLPEILSQQVGVFVEGFGGLGKLSTVSIRGSSAEQVSVFLDGIKINTAQGAAVDFSTLPLGGVERIEVIRGGASSRFGSDAIGGVINILTKKAQKKPAWEVKAGGGSFLTLEGRGGFSKRFGDVGLALNYSHLSSRADFSFLSTPVILPGGTEIGGGQEFTRIHNGFFSEGFLSRVDAPLGKKGHLSFVNDFFYTSRDEPGPEIETTQPSGNPLEAHNNLFRDAAGFNFTFNDVGTDNFVLSFLPNYRIERSHFTDPSPALGPDIDVTSLSQAWAGQLRAAYEWAPTGKVPHHHFLEFFYEPRYAHFNDSSPLEGASLSGTHTRLTHGIFASDEIAFFAGNLILNPTVRFEHASDFGGRFAMHFGMEGRPTSWMTLRTNVDNAFRYPDFNELFFPNQGFIRGNPDLDPESSINFDAGIQMAHQTPHFGIQGELTYFRNAIENSIVFVPISAFTIAPLNTGPVTAQGMEASLQIKPHPWITLSGNYTLTLARLNNTDTQLPGRPRHLANGEFRLDWKYAAFFARVQYIDNLPLDFPNTKFIRARALVDVGATFKWKNNWFVTVEGKNVGNVQTLDSLGFPLPRAQVYASVGYKS